MCSRSSTWIRSRNEENGHAKQGAAFGPTKIQGKSLLVRGLNVLAASICTPLAAAVIAGTRLRGGNDTSARGAASMITEAVATASARRVHGTLIVRMDSAFNGAPAVQAARQAGAYFSVTVRTDPKVRAAIAAIGEDAWTPIRYPRAVWDDQLGRWVSEAEVAETSYTAFTRKKGQAITARLIVRRVKDLNTKTAPEPGRAVHRLALPRHLHRLPVRACCKPKTTTAATPRPSRSSPTGPTGRWRTCRRAPSRPTPPGSPCAAMSSNLLRAAGALASLTYARARGATVRRDLIDVAARTARRGRRPPHRAPARRLAPRARMDEPARSRLRAASNCGLTSPDPVSAPRRPRRPPADRQHSTQARTVGFVST